MAIERVRATYSCGQGSAYRNVQTFKVTDPTPAGMAALIRRGHTYPPCITEAMGARMATDLAETGRYTCGAMTWEVID